MALESPYNLSGFAPSGIQDLNAPLVAPFFIERVQLQFEVSKFAAVQVANNVIILALETGKLLRIDLASPQDVEGERAPVGICMEAAIWNKHWTGANVLS